MDTMTCDQVQERLHQWVDGELPADEAAQVEASISGCPECEAELAEILATQALAKEALAGGYAGDVDLSGVYPVVMARIAAEDAAQARLERGDAPTRSWLDRIFELVRLDQPILAYAAAGLALGFAGLLWWSLSASPAPDAPVGQPAVAGDMDTTTRGARRGIELEGRTEGSVLDHQIAEGRFHVEFENDPDAPMVVWHEVVEETEDPPATTPAAPSEATDTPTPSLGL